MNAYLFNAWTTHWHQGRLVDGCPSAIVCSPAREIAERDFKAGFLLPAAPEEPPRLERLFCTPVLDTLLTEAGPKPLEWLNVKQQLEDTVLATEVDDLAQGYWVDCNQWPPPDCLSATVESLEKELPEDIRTGLNWSPSKMYFFLVSVLSPPPVMVEYVDDYEDEPTKQTDETAETFFQEMDNRECPLPEVVPKELAVIAHARNSVVAAWLWRKHAVGDVLGGNAIRVDACCQLVTHPEGKD
jgi:hypothetical protein